TPDARILLRIGWSTQLGASKHHSAPEPEPDAAPTLVPAEAKPLPVITKPQARTNDQDNDGHNDDSDACPALPAQDQPDGCPALVSIDAPSGALKLDPM